VWLLVVAGAAGLLLKLGRGTPPIPKPTSPNPASVAATASLGIVEKASANGLLVAAASPVATAAAAFPAVSLAGLGTTFLKVGLVFFGGGFVLIPVLYQRLVGELGWLTPRQFTDGVAISQLTPGPIAVLATFAGYGVQGIVGAIVATVALFTPSTILMLAISHYYQRLRSIRRVQDFLAGVVPAVVGLIVAAAVAMAPGSLSLHHPAGIALAVLALWVLWQWKWHPAIVLGIGAVCGTVLPAWFSQT
jgi:chromate transporter